MAFLGWIAPRALFYTSKLAADVLSKGEDYKALPTSP
jgi:hypothetical protein